VLLKIGGKLLGAQEPDRLSFEKRLYEINLGDRTLTPLIKVRILVPQPIKKIDFFGILWG